MQYSTSYTSRNLGMSQMTNAPNTFLLQRSIQSCSNSTFGVKRIGFNFCKPYTSMSPCICTYFTCVNEYFTARKPKTQVAGNLFITYPVNQQLSQLPNQIEHHGRPSAFGEQPGKSIYSF